MPVDALQQVPLESQEKQQVYTNAARCRLVCLGVAGNIGSLISYDQLQGHQPTCDASFVIKALQ